jgi:inhibitor of KinA sporulation pathway (predicted exonuclease)
MESFLVVDLEATTSPDGSLAQGEREIIEIGAVLVAAGHHRTLGEYQSLVRPVRLPDLNAFTSELTGITAAMVADAPEFPAALEGLRRALLEGREDVLFCSWGNFDRRQLLQDCELHGIPDPMPAHLNLKERFAELHGQRRRPGLRRALRLCGLEFEGRLHRGLDDARNIARLLPWVVEDRPLP